MKNSIPLLLALSAWCGIVAAQPDKNSPTTYETKTNILYYDHGSSDLDPYTKERCRLDLYYPSNRSGYPTVVWFHGGGLKGGNRFVPAALQKQGIAVAAASYRLYPKVKCPVYIEDAAAAVAWVFKHIKRFRGSPDQIVVSGHSAGGYLTSMVGMDKQWLDAHRIDANRIAALVPYSGHTITHFTVRDERGIPGKQPIVDALAPLYHVRADAPPLVLITGDRDLEMLGRYEENAYLWRMMQVVGHKQSLLYEIQGFNHGGMAEPAHSILLDYINKELVKGR